MIIFPNGQKVSYIMDDINNNGMYYVAVDIGCIECGEPSAVLGIFENKEKALNKLKEAEEYQAAHWSGQHSFELFEIEEITK